jgi:hypothetical protein
MILPNGRPSLYTAYGPAEVRPEQASPAAADWHIRIDDWIGRHPAFCVAAALTLGVTLGWLIKRR